MTDASRAVVSLAGVSLNYGATRALADVDLRVGEGERVALVGPSGAGKSSLLRLCNGTAVPTSGRVEVLSRALSGCTTRQLRDLRRRVGTVHQQQLNLVGSLRVIHNVNAGHLGRWSLPRALLSLVRPLEVEAARAALRRIGIEEKAFERTDHLSGGEQQRVALARVLVQEPDLILADEPVSSLDPARSLEVMDLLTRVVTGRQRSLVVSLHDFDIARRTCDRVVGIRAGRVHFDRPAADVTDAMGTELYRIEP
jgi:phosphonate transport system ATP-binding protein